MLACGIGGYFQLRFEPSNAAIIGLAFGVLVMAALSVLAWRYSVLVTIVCLFPALAMAGVVLASWRVSHTAGPLLQWRYYGPIEGRVVGIDRSASDRLRILLADVRLSRMSPSQTPRRVRVTLTDRTMASPPAGARVMLTGHLSAPRGPAEPGGFQFHRHLWFLSIGGVGYTRTPLLLVNLPQESSVFRVRMWLGNWFRARLPGDVGSFAAAITAGDRSGISREALSTLRVANLAHLLAISGLHMGLVAGLAFAVFRGGLAAIPWVALRLPLRRIAAAAALVLSTGYLLLSGGSVATERAYIMVLVMLLAVMADRRAFSLRGVALAAIVVLTMRPEAMLSPGFQMSFAATTALVSVFSALRYVRPLGGWWKKRWVRGITGVAASSLIAGLATAPVAAVHFNTVSTYGFIANVISVPLMGLLIIPAAGLSAILAPVGAEMVALVPMGWGIEWILGVSDRVSSWQGARKLVPDAPPWMLPTLALACLWSVLWHGHFRWVGIGVAAASLMFWTTEPRPKLLIDGSGGLIGIMTDAGRAVSREKTSGFVASVWLNNDGDLATQLTAAGRWQQTLDPDRHSVAQSKIIRRMTTPVGDVVHVLGKRGLASWGKCADDDIVVFTVPVPENHPLRNQRCQIIDPVTLRTSGALAWANGQWYSAAHLVGNRPWAGR
jgi:competence protein ComEC